MKITDPGTRTIHAATQGDLRAIDAVLSGIQPDVFNLAVRMLGNRDDAADATQEIRPAVSGRRVHRTVCR